MGDRRHGKSWVRRAGVASCALAAALVAAAVGAGTSLGAEGESSIRAQAEQAVIVSLADCVRLERDVAAALARAPYDRQAVLDLLTESIDCLNATETLLASDAIGDGPGVRRAISNVIALVDFEEALFRRLRAADTPSAKLLINAHLGLAESIDIKAKCRYFVDGNQAPTRGEITEWLDSLSVLSATERFDRPTLKVPYGVRQDVARAVVLSLADREGARSLRAGDAGPRKAPAKSQDRYLAWRAARRNATEPGFGFRIREVPMTGPFAVEITAGAFTTNAAALAERGTAYACIEVDAAGVSPPDFFAVCARPTADGVQAFASRTGGVNLGQAFFPGATRLRLRIVYDATTFSGFAKPDGADDSAYVPVGTFARPQGATVWYAGHGAAALTGRAEIGLDDLRLEALR